MDIEKYRKILLPDEHLKAVSYGEIFSRNICPKFLLTDICPPHDLGNMESVLRFRNFNFWFSWRDMKAFRSGVTGGRKKGNIFIGPWFLCISNTVPLFHARRSAYYVHETEEIYTPTQLNFAKLTKEPSATYQIRLWSQRGT